MVGIAPPRSEMLTLGGDLSRTAVSTFTFVMHWHTGTSPTPSFLSHHRVAIKGTLVCNKENVASDFGWDVTKCIYWSWKKNAFVKPYIGTISSCEFRMKKSSYEFMLIIVKEDFSVLFWFFLPVDQSADGGQISFEGENLTEGIYSSLQYFASVCSYIGPWRQVVLS